MGSVIVPAHNEAAVLGRTLTPLVPLAESGIIELVVAANACIDRTVEVARESGVNRVVVLKEASKTRAINHAEQETDRFPRVYLDADIEISAEAITAVLQELVGGPALAARPPFLYDTSGSSRIVRAYFRARSRLPANFQALWGAGIYALSKEGRARFSTFPELVADDLFVDSLFAAEEIRIVAAPPVVVRVPRTARALRAVLRRTYGGNAGLYDARPAEVALVRRETGNFRALLRSVRSPTSLCDALVYAGFVVLGRIDSRTTELSWARDDSSRS